MTTSSGSDAPRVAAPPPEGSATGASAGPRPRRRRRRLLIAVLAAAVLAYAGADAHGRVPGVLTTAPAPEPARPFPEPAATPLPVGTPAPLAPRAGAPTAVQGLVDGLARDPRVVAATPGGPGAGGTDPEAPDVAVDPVVGLAAQQSVPPGTPPSVLVLDAATGQVLAQSLPHTPRLPASTLKILTAAAATTTLPAGGVLTTRTSLAEGGVVTLVGGGDVLLAAGAGDPAAVVGRAGIADLADATAAALTAAGVTTVTLRLDDTALPPEGLAPGLMPEDTRWVMPPAALAVEEGAGSGTRAADPGMEAAGVLAAALQERGVTVQGVERGPEPDGADALGAVHSAPVAALVHHAVKESDNTLTEALARQVALARGLPTDRAGSVAAVTAALEDLGIDLTGVYLADTSGLSPHNRATATVLAQTVALGVRGGTRGEGSDGTGPPDPAEASAPLPGLVASLPVAALDGTLDDRMHGPAAGVARAKTGTLGAVASLAGVVVDADGRLLIHVVLADGLPRDGLGPARAAQDEFVAALAGCGCR